jgi:hypothetical protein
MRWLCACGGGLVEQPAGIVAGWLGAEDGEDFPCRVQWLAGVAWLAEGEQAPTVPEQRLGVFPWHLELLPAAGGVGEQACGFDVLAVVFGKQGRGR